MLFLALLSCTCNTTSAPAPEAPAPVAAVPLLEAHRPLCETPLGCGLLAHYPLEAVEASLCDWCGEIRPAFCDGWLPAAPDAALPRCAIWGELERCAMQHAGARTLADLDPTARQTVIDLQQRLDNQIDCVEGSAPN